MATTLILNVSQRRLSSGISVTVGSTTLPKARLSVYSPRFSGDIESSYLTSNASKTSVLLYGDCVYFYAGNTDNSEWLTKDFRNKPFGTAKLTVSDIKLIWQSDSLDRFSFTVKNAENVQAKK